MRNAVRKKLIKGRAKRIFRDFNKQEYAMLTEKLRQDVLDDVLVWLNGIQDGSPDFEEGAGLEQSVQKIMEGYLIEKDYLASFAKEGAAGTYLESMEFEFGLKNEEFVPFHETHEDAYRFIGYQNIVIARIADISREKGLEAAVAQRGKVVSRLFTEKEFIEHEILGIKTGETHLLRVLELNKDTSTPFRKAMWGLIAGARLRISHICGEIMKDHTYEDANIFYRKT